MGKLKITSWNVEHLNELIVGNLSPVKQTRLNAIVREIREISPDIFCLIEGPAGEAAIDKFSNDFLAGDYFAVKSLETQES